MAEGAERGKLPSAGVFKTLNRRKEIVAVCTIALAGAAFAISISQDPRYEATASVLVRPDREGGVTTSEVVVLSGADEIAARTGEELGGADPSFIDSRITVAEGNARGLVDVEGTSDTPEVAADLATAYAKQIVDYTDELGDEFAGETELQRSASPPADPVSPDTVRNTLVGALAGLLIGLVAAFVRERLDRRVHSARDLEPLLGVPLLGRISESPGLQLGAGLRHLPAVDAEGFQMARVAIRYLDLPQEPRSLLLTSPQSGDGKTTIAFGLASAAATAGDRVLLIEADMRQPTLAVVVEPTRAGLSTVLGGRASLDDAVQSVEVEAGAEGVAGTLALIQCGPTPPNPTQLLESERMASLLREAAESYDVVIVDTPPATVLADAIPLTGQVDGVVVVTGLDRDTIDELDELRDRLGQVNAPLIGAIANFAQAPDESYFQYIRAHEAAVAEEGTVPLRPVDGRRRELRRRRSATPARPRRAPDGLVDLNHASYEQLRGLDLTITQAKRLIAYRDRRGGFDTLDDIDDVPGFPDDVRDELKSRATV
jgi:capsular exopolysaccharide synthesis family protein